MSWRGHQADGFKNTILLFVCPFKIVHKHCFHLLLGLTMAPRENKNNTYAKFWRGKQRVLWYFRNHIYNKYNREQLTHTETRPSNTPSFASNCWNSRLIRVHIRWVNGACIEIHSSLTFLISLFRTANVPVMLTRSYLVLQRHRAWHLHKRSALKQEYRKCHLLM